MVPRPNPIASAPYLTVTPAHLVKPKKAKSASSTQIRKFSSIQIGITTKKNVKIDSRGHTNHDCII